jgi:hypothetical protein
MPSIQSRPQCRRFLPARTAAILEGPIRRLRRGSGRYDRGLRLPMLGIGRISCVLRCVGPKYRCPVFSKVEMSAFPFSITHGRGSGEESAASRRRVPARSSRASRRVVVRFATFASVRSRCWFLMKSNAAESRLFSTASPCCTPCSFGKAVDRRRLHRPGASSRGRQTLRQLDHGRRMFGPRPQEPRAMSGIHPVPDLRAARGLHEAVRSPAPMATQEFQPRSRPKLSEQPRFAARIRTDERSEVP